MNKKIKNLKNKFLDNEVKLDFKTCQETCDCCEDSLGCTKWKWVKVNRNEKLEDKIKELKAKKESLKAELKEVFSESEKERIKKEIELTEKSIQKAKESKEERVKEFTIRLREEPEDDTLAHEFTHVFLVYHYDFSEHHGKGEISEKKNAHFWSLKEWFLAQIKD